MFTRTAPLDCVACAERVHRLASDSSHTVKALETGGSVAGIQLSFAGCCLWRIIPFRPLTSDSALKKAASGTGRQKVWRSAGIRP
ncbi:hypothetical protein [Microbulbifer sp. PSTR4-B]|uniref:hypothetical protein n=1 Tax=unclassified Microbulbifer TaxID=2619833 RepID=UPI00403ABD35